mgnify:CR=1 FL=1
MEERPYPSGDPLLLAYDAHALPRTPMIRLFAALLDDACFCLHPAALVSRDTRAETVAWVRGEIESAALCSFREVCDILGLDPQAVRARLLCRAAGRSPLRPRATAA